MKKWIISILLALPLMASAASPLFVQVPQLSLDTANKIATATIAACRVKGINIAVTVVDRFGIPMGRL
jgi:hypothetical protein